LQIARKCLFSEFGVFAHCRGTAIHGFHLEKMLKLVCWPKLLNLGTAIMTDKQADTILYS
jgi:hypothetical protein